jgi:hypothetical protein
MVAAFKKIALLVSCVKGSNYYQQRNTEMLCLPSHTTDVLQYHDGTMHK